VGPARRGRPVVIAYIDANAVEDLCRLRAGVTAPQRAVIVDAVRAGGLVVPASTFVAEELLAAAGTKPEVARELGVFYLEIVSQRHHLRQPFDVLQDTMRAIARRAGRPSPFEPLTQDQVAEWSALADLSAAGGVAAVVGAGKARIEEFRDIVRLNLPDDLDGAGQLTFEQLWRRWGVRYARTLAERFGVRAALRGRYREVLRDPVVRAAVGGVLGNLYAQIANRRKVAHGDSRDLQHLVLAAATGGPLVTGDARLRGLVEKGGSWAWSCSRSRSWSEGWSCPRGTGASRAGAPDASGRSGRALLHALSGLSLRPVRASTGLRRARSTAPFAARPVSAALHGTLSPTSRWPG
jgi:hypothetical protein